MSHYGLVELTEGEHGALVPRVPYESGEAGRLVDCGSATSFVSGASLADDGHIPVARASETCLKG